MPVEYLSVEQEARYGRFAAEPAPGELERFFRLDATALESARAKRLCTVVQDEDEGVIRGEDARA